VVVLLTDVSPVLPLIIVILSGREGTGVRALIKEVEDLTVSNAVMLVPVNGPEIVVNPLIFP
jgi:hypothetical protein